MNKSIIAIALAATIPLTVLAGAGGSKESPRHEKKMERMVETLNLNEAQKGQVETLLKEQWEKHRAVRQETRTRLEAVLTPEQMEKWDEKHKRRFKRSRDGKPCEKR
ncbi:MAG: hypothetical protein Kow0060_11800 [Methylohalobius crimeensis]